MGGAGEIGVGGGRDGREQRGEWANTLRGRAKGGILKSETIRVMWSQSSYGRVNDINKGEGSRENGGA